jgi:hypothetical protein
MPSSWNIHTLFVPFVTALSTVLVIQIIVDSIKGESVKTISIAHRSVRYFLPTLVICFIFMTWKLITFLPVLIVYWVDLSRAGKIILTSAKILMDITVWAYAVFVYPAMVLKGKSPVSAFRHSFEMVRGRWWKILWAWVVITLPAGLVCFLIQKMMVHLDLMLIGKHALWSLYSLVNSFSIIGITILFLNIDRRNHSSCRSWCAKKDE